LPESTLVDAAELGEFLRLEADEVKILARAGVLPRDREGRFSLVKAIQGYLKLEESAGGACESGAGGQKPKDRQGGIRG
jgi:hypothetical protein